MKFASGTVAYPIWFEITLGDIIWSYDTLMGIFHHNLGLGYLWGVGWGANNAKMGNFDHVWRSLVVIHGGTTKETTSMN